MAEDTDTLDQQDADTQDQTTDQDQTTTTGNTDASSTTVTVNQTETPWYDSLSPDLKDNPTIQKYKTQEDAHKAHLELSTLLGHDKIAIPKDAEDKVAIENFNKTFGIPMTAEGYELENPTPPEGMENMEFGMEGFKEVAHRHGLSTKQAQGLMTDYVGMLGEIRKGSEQQYIDNLNETKGELTKEWGLKFESNIKLGQNVMNKFTDSKEEFDHINALLGADPKAQRFLAKIGGSFSEGSLGDLGTHNSDFTKTPAAAKEEYEVIMNDPKDVYWSGTNNEAPAVPEKVRRERISHVEGLLKMMNAGDSEKTQQSHVG